MISAIQRAKAEPSGLPGPMPDALDTAIGASTSPMAATMPPVTTGGISFSTQACPAPITIRPMIE